MIVVISPAKNLDYKTPVPINQHSNHEFTAHTQALVERCQQLTPADLSRLMGISDKLALLNAERFATFTQPFTLENARQALYAFNGDVYAGLDAHSLSAADVDYAQAHLRILSGLYGMLKPLDLMQPYRLEMGTKLDTDKGQSLYEYWGSELTDALNRELPEHSEQVLLNLASNEYFSAVQPTSLVAQVISPVFKDEKNGQYKIISFYAKKARGLMARWVLQNRIENASQLNQFDVAGYRYDPEQSTPTSPVFMRSEIARG